MTPFPPEEVVPGATNPPNPTESANPSGNDRSGDLRAELAAVAHGAFDSSITNPAVWTTSPHEQIELAVDAILAAGYRRVVEDDTTVDRIAAAMFDDYNTWIAWDQGDEADRERFRGFARAAVRALREGGAE